VVQVIVSLVRFTSRLSAEEVQAAFEDRADRYRSVPGLMEKIYLRFRDSGEFGAVYVWDSEESLARFKESDLARSIAETYEVDGAPSSELAEVTLLIRPRAIRAAAAS
jgi:heme-degrading monooxygenase HmoA